MTAEAGHAETAKKPKTIEILVNNKTVRVEDRDLTGHEIKQAAGIEASFTLYNHKGEEIKNEQRVRVHPNEKFTAISGQDVS